MSYYELLDKTRSSVFLRSEDLYENFLVNKTAEIICRTHSFFSSTLSGSGKQNELP